MRATRSSRLFPFACLLLISAGFVPGGCTGNDRIHDTVSIAGSAPQRQKSVRADAWKRIGEEETYVDCFRIAVKLFKAVPFDLEPRTFDR